MKLRKIRFKVSYYLCTLGRRIPIHMNEGSYHHYTAALQMLSCCSHSWNPPTAGDRRPDWHTSLPGTSYWGLNKRNISVSRQQQAAQSADQFLAGTKCQLEQTEHTIVPLLPRICATFILKKVKEKKHWCVLINELKMSGQNMIYWLIYLFYGNFPNFYSSIKAKRK